METKLAQPELVDYGIHNEASNIRAHVGVLAALLFVFPTRPAANTMRRYPVKRAYQPGVTYATAAGHTVPIVEIPHLRTLRIAPERLVGFHDALSTTEKGNRAVQIVEAFLKGGRFPLWFEGEFVQDAEIQQRGTDLIVRGQWRIEVKCDYRAGPKTVPGCSGNLYLQTAECNPFKRH